VTSTAREHVRSEIARLAQSGSLDAANGDVLDAWLEGLRGQWHAQHEAERTERIAAARHEVGRLEAEVLRATLRAETAAADLKRTSEHLRVVEKRILEPAEAQAEDRRERRRRPRATIDPLEGLERRWWHGLFLKFLVVMAAAGDVVTFNVTLSGFFTDSGPLVLWGLTLALAAVSVGSMHSAGQALKSLREGRGGHGRGFIAALVFGWLVIGAVAVVFRVMVATPQTGSQSAFGGDPAAEAAAAAHDALLSAILLGGLFIASGLLAFYAGYADHHPRMKTYKSLRKQLPEHSEKAAVLAAEAERVRRSLEHARGEEARAHLRATDGHAAADAEIAALKELVRVELAAHLGMPEATTGLVVGRHAEASGDRDGVSADDEDPGAPPPVPSPRNDPSGPPRDPSWPRTELWSAPVPASSGNGHGSVNGHPSSNGSH
jgi:hypothetical protein